MRRLYRSYLTLLAVLLAGCTTGPARPTLAPTLPFPTPYYTPTSLPVQPQAPGITPQPPQPTLAPGEPTPVTTATSLPVATWPANGQLPTSCLRYDDYLPVANAYLTRYQHDDLRAAWNVFVDQHGERVNTSIYSIYDAGNTFALVSTYRYMLLLGEYRIRIEQKGAIGHGYCTVVAYYGFDQPEIGVLLSDATLNDTWSGFSYGRTSSEQETRRFISENIGKAVVVRYVVSQDPQDENRVRPGFFSPTMRLLWEDSYYTIFRRHPDALKNGVVNSKTPTIQEMMSLAASYKNVGVFLDYIADPQ